MNDIAMNNDRHALLILGMHRSGTSAVAGALVKRGAAPPMTLLKSKPDNPLGFFESYPIMAFHDDLLTSAGSHWNDWRAFDSAWYDGPAAANFRERGRHVFHQEFGESRLFVLKDPRVCRFARFWFDIFREDGVAVKPILPIRLPLEVASSLRVREGFSAAESLLLWLRHTLDAEAVTRGMPRTFVLYESLLSDWRSQIELIARHAGIAWPSLTPSVEQDIDGFLTRELRHHNSHAEELRLHPDMHAWMTSAYQAFVELTSDPASRTACAALDQIRVSFDEAAQLFGRLYVSHADDELHRLCVEHRRTAEQIRQLEIAREHAHATLEGERQLLGETRADLDVARRDLAHTRARLDAIEASTLWRMTGPLRRILARP